MTQSRIKLPLCHTMGTLLKLSVLHFAFLTGLWWGLNEIVHQSPRSVPGTEQALSECQLSSAPSRTLTITISHNTLSLHSNVCIIMCGMGASLFPCPFPACPFAGHCVPHTLPRGPAPFSVSPCLRGWQKGQRHHLAGGTALAFITEMGA